MFEQFDIITTTTKAINFGSTVSPEKIITGDRVKRLSTDAKLLYGLLMDRMSVSARNGWYEEPGRVYIYYTLDEIREDLNCGHEKAVKLLAELDTNKGAGLIECIKQRQRKPPKIFVKRSTTHAVPPQPEPERYPVLPAPGYPGSLTPNFPDSRPLFFSTSAPPKSR